MDSLGDIPQGDIFIEQGKIGDTGHQLTVKADEDDGDQTGYIITPGFAQRTHAHLANSLACTTAS
jgi:cytosine/adenosine deaminase-related metal-dependent hydrolase